MQLLKEKTPRFLSITGFANLILSTELEGTTEIRLDKNTLSPLTIPPYPPTQESKKRVENEGEGVENDERQRGVLVGEEGAREGILSEEINRPLEEPKSDPKYKPAADHPWRTDDLNIGRNVIPDELRDFDQQIRDFWKVKKGSKNKTAWARQMTQLIAILKKYGPRALGEQLDEAALKGTWQAITLKNYEEFGVKRSGGEAEFKHPAHQVFTAEEHYAKPEWDVTPPPGSVGVLDGVI